MSLILIPARSPLMVEDQLLEQLPSETEDREQSLYTYEILTYPADYTLEVLVSRWHKKLITVPDEQRQFVWNQAQSSKLIESFLMGLPVPPVYFYQHLNDSKLQVVDGLQRLLSIVYFFSGVFGELTIGDETSNGNGGEDRRTPTARRLPVFSLIGLNKKSPYKERTYEWLRENDETAFSRLQNSVLRSFVMKQLQPKDNTSIFQVFERLNSGGMVLQPQEIRNCIYTGVFNKLLKTVNTSPTWRKIVGGKTPDRRMRDIELILRFFAVYYNVENYEKPMKGFLNDFMDTNRDLTDNRSNEFQAIFERTAIAALRYLGPKPFHIKRGLNAAVFDAVFTAFARRIDGMEQNVTDDRIAAVRDRYEQLKKDADFIKWTSSATTDEDVVPKRINKAEQILFSN